MTDYEVGQYVRLKPSSSNADISCVCVVGKRGATRGSTDLRECWHGPSTTVLRIFEYGGLLLENRSGCVRVAQPDQVCR